jgi:hypothetical protein
MTSTPGRLATSRPPFRRGLTFTEAILAAAIVAMAAVTIIGTMNAVVAASRRGEHRLACAELANRLLLQYLDDATSMPPDGTLVDSGLSRYRWQLREVPVSLEPAQPNAPGRREGRPTPRIDRLRAVTITVWLSEESGGSTSPDGGVPMAALTRITDPLNPRNPDSMENLLSNPDALRRWLEAFSAGAEGRLPPPSQQPPPGAPAGGPGR